MDVSTVIVSYNGRDLLRRCLASVFEHTRDVECEVVVVDNASQDGTPDMVEAEFPSARLVRRATNGGFAVGVNEGFANARGEAFLVLNPDTELTAPVLAPLLSYAREHRDAGLLAPKLLDPDGTLQLSCRAFPGYSAALFNRYSLLTKLFRRNPAARRYLMTDFDHSSIAEVDWVSAACWLLPRTTYERIGGLDEGYFWSVEDIDYCQRVHRAGLRVVYFPDVSVRHHIGGSSSSAASRAVIARHRGMWRYYRSYLRPRGPLSIPMDVAVWLGISARLAAQLALNGVRKLLGR
ncbi:MAG: glycosyltransferase family 2 protein [Dehalococcoidia bacterium]